MAEYRALGNGTRCRHLPDADLAPKSLQPVRRLEVDAAILFRIPPAARSDGAPFDSSREKGADRAANRVPADIDRLRTFSRATRWPTSWIPSGRQGTAGACRIAGLPARPSRSRVRHRRRSLEQFARTKSLMYGHPDAWHRLCDRLATIVGDYLTAQVDAGVDAVQLFDSWVGALSPADYREFAMPHTQRIFQALGRRVPTIHFGTGTSAMLQELREAGGDVIGVDWRIPLDVAWQRIGHDAAVQGNLDPTLRAGRPPHLGQTDDILPASPAAGHIFNWPASAVYSLRSLAECLRVLPTRLDEPWNDVVHLLLSHCPFVFRFGPAEADTTYLE